MQTNQSHIPIRWSLGILLQTTIPCHKILSWLFYGQKGNSYLSLYKRWSTPVTKQRHFMPPLLLPSCNSNDIVFFIHVNYDNTHIYAKRTMSNSLAFIDRSILHLALKQPFYLGKAEWNYTDQQQLKYEANPTRNKGLPIKTQHIDASKFNATIHALQKLMGGCAAFTGPLISHHQFLEL